MADTIAEAERYVGYGWRVVPVRGKIPVGQGWQHLATSDPAEARALFERTSHDGVGVVLGELSGVIDLEADSEEAERQIVELFDGQVPETPTFQSTRGRHRLFQWSPDLPPSALTKAKWMAGAIEIRAGGGSKAAQTVFPPSGGRAWIVDPKDTPLAELPELAIARLSSIGATEKKREPVKALSLVLPPAPRDGRLDVSRWLARRGATILDHDIKDGVSRWFIRCPGIEAHTGKDAIRDCVITQGQSGEMGGHCFHTSCGMNDWQALKQSIGAPTHEDYDGQLSSTVDVSGLIESIRESIQESRNCEPVAVVADDDQESENEILGESDDCTFPAECLEPLGTLGKLVRHTLATSMYRQPELALAASIALLGAYTGRKVADTWRTRTNVMILGLAPSGAGKDHARGVSKDVICAVGNMGMMGSERIGSHAGIISALERDPAQLMQLDEMGRLLETMKDPRRSPHLFNCITVLMQLYSSSAKTWKADAYADAAKVKMIEQPHLCIYGTSTPDSFWQSLTTQNISEGLVGRLMVFEGRGYEVKRTTPAEDELPTDVIETFKSWNEYKPNGILSATFPAPTTARYTAEAQARYESHSSAIIERRPDEHKLRAALWSRSAEKTAKLSLIHACSRCEGPPESIELIDVEWAIKLSNYLTRRLLKGCSEHVSENDIEARCKRVLAMITEGGISLTQLTRQTQWLRSRERSEILSDLMAMGAISVEQVSGKTKAKMLLRRTKSALKKP